METAEKFALIPEEMLSKHTPTEKEISDFDRAMLKILNSSLPDHEKVRQYYELLKRKINLQDFNPPWIPKSQGEPETHPQEKELENHPEKDEKNFSLKQELICKRTPTAREKQDIYTPVILNSVHPRFTKQAEYLLQLLKSHPNIISWNEQGELLYKDQVFPKSNLADMFNLIFSNRKVKNFLGKNEFFQALEEINVPKHFVKNRHIHAKQEILSTPTKIKKERDVRNWDNFKIK